MKLDTLILAGDAGQHVYVVGHQAPLDFPHPLYLHRLQDISPSESLY